MADSANVPASHPFRDVYSVSRLNREARATLEGQFPLLWVEGEISNLARPGSGHWYFSLKDPFAQVRCAMFRMRNVHVGFQPENGMQVLLRARIGLYEPRGDFQLVAEHMEEAGDGALRRAFEALKQRLHEEGLFAAERKRPLPSLPRCIGVVTSPSGAAIRDILSVLARRFPAIPVLVYPVPVQGAEAARQIAAAISRAGQRGDCDVLIVGRGGGSLEDLWAFNEEVVARAIAASTIPVVSAVGHEVDFTIADLAADQRAPTPSAAAELLSPDGAQWLAQARWLEQRLSQAMTKQLRQRGQRLESVQRRLKHPGRRLQEIAQRLDELELRLFNGQRAAIGRRADRLAQRQAQLRACTPQHRLNKLETRSAELTRRLSAAMFRTLERRGQQLGTTLRTLDTVSPLATLARGYAIVSRTDNGTILRTTDQVRPGDQVEARLGQGRLHCTVEELTDD